MKNYLITVSTRTPSPEKYPDGLARAVHFAAGRDGALAPLRADYGILFAKATLDENNVICPKCVKNPGISRLSDCSFAVTAIRTREDGSADCESRGQFLLWTSPDLCHFSEQQLISLPETEDLEALALTQTEEGYRAVWRNVAGETRMACAETLEALAEAATVPGVLPEDCATVALTAEEYDAVCFYWSPLRQVGVQVPETVQAASADELAGKTIDVVYSDGTTAQKHAKWDLSGVDFAKPGSYPISGQLVTQEYPLDLAVNFADPVLFYWDNRYYFLSTNDGTDDIGLYVREADSVEALFHEDTPLHLILPYDPARGLIQTFWAPEFHVIGGELYILFAVGGEKWAPQCHMMRLKKGGSIVDADSWEDPIRVLLPDGSNLTDEGISLDMTYFVAGGVPYLCWSYRFAIGTPLDSGSMLYIAKADPSRPWQLASEPVLLSRPLYGWENVSGTINNEGPYALFSGDTVYLAYSGGSARGYTYTVGFLTANVHDDLTDPASWTKTPTAALAFPDVEGQMGCGHNSFFRDSVGDIWFCYHGVPNYTEKIVSSSIRRVQIDRDGRPRLDLSAQRDLDPALSEIHTTLLVL